MLWVPYTLFAAVMFTICNTAFSEVSELGAPGLFYMSGGPLICGLLFFAYKMTQNKVENGVFWTDMNIKDSEG
jgi:hypothetical protein